MNNYLNSSIPSNYKPAIEIIHNKKDSTSLSVKSESSEAYQFLQSHYIFSRLASNELKILGDSSRFASLDSGQYITVEGEEESLRGFIVVSGRLSMMKTSLSGKELIVELLSPGDIFGLLVSLSLEKLPAQLSAKAQVRSRILWMPINNLKAVLNVHPLIYREFVAYLLHSLQSAYKISRGLAHDRVEVRIATLLLSLALRFSKQLLTREDNTIEITRQQIADLTGTTTETAIRVTRAMQSQGQIEIKRPGVIRLLDLDALHELSEKE